ncbi:MAG: protein translocase subunit SecD [Coriobacteriia bacterium]
MDQRQKHALALVVVIVLVALAWWQFWPPSEKIRQGLDIQGGLSVILTAVETTQSPVNEATMERAELIVRNRVDRLGVSEASIQRQGLDSILVQLPGINNPEQALETLGSTGQLEFVDANSLDTTGPIEQGMEFEPGSYDVLLTGDVITNAFIDTDPMTNEIAVSLTMTNEGAQKWADITTQRAGRTGKDGQIVIMLDGVVQSAPMVREPILDGSTQITGNFTPEEAKSLKTVLETGALPVTLEFSESRVVGPTLGQESLRQGLLAALAGLALVALFMAVYYRGLGVISWFTLAIFSSLFLGLLATLSSFGLFALSLPGIAGIVLTIGLAADSSILIFERFKEEVRMGKSYRSAAKSGTKHAILTSLDADVVTLVTALALYFVAIGPVRGFALTLTMGICIDIVVMVLFTRTAVIMLAEKAGKTPWLFGLKGGEADA